jgi:hypothetical protein
LVGPSHWLSTLCCALSAALFLLLKPYGDEHYEGQPVTPAASRTREGGGGSNKDRMVAYVQLVQEQWEDNCGLLLWLLPKLSTTAAYGEGTSCCV